MDRRTKLKIAAGAAAALVLATGLGAAGALAAAHVLSDDDERQAVIDDAAADLGVEPGQLSDALEQALKNRIDDAVEDGRLTEEQGAQLKERLEQSDAPPLVLPGLDGRMFGDRLFDFGGPGRIHVAVDLEAAASYLGLTASELHDELAEGKSLADVARDEGKSVDGLVQALVDAAEESIDEAVADGRLSEERAADLKQDLEERIRDRVNDELRLGGPGWHRFDRGSELPRGFRGQHG